MGRLARIAATLKQKYREEKAHLKGEGISQARMIKNAKDIPQISTELQTVAGPAKPISGANVRMHNGQPMTFFSDGSLRNGYGAKPAITGRQFRKLRKQVRRDRKEALKPPTKCSCHVGEANIAYHAPVCPEFNPNGTPKKVVSAAAR